MRYADKNKLCDEIDAYMTGQQFLDKSQPNLFIVLNN